VKIRIFGALDWLSSVCGLAVMTLKQQIIYLNPLGFNFVVFRHNVPTTNVRRPIKGSRDGDVFAQFFFKTQNAPYCGWGPRPDFVG